MYVLLTILIVIAAVLLVLLVLVQNSKGGGLAAGFSSGNQVMGAPKTADFLEKASWTITEQVQEAYEAEQAAQAVPEFEAEATEEVAE